MKWVFFLIKSKMILLKNSLKNLEKSKELNLTKNIVVEPQKENITYEDFAKMDIRIGT